MTRLTLLVIALFAFVAIPVLALAQEAALHEGSTVAATEVSGLPRDQLSPGLRADMDALVGQPLTRDRVNALAVRIETEHPDVVAAVRDVALPDGRVRVMFLAAKISDDSGLLTNINARYTVDRVDIEGVDESRISQALRDELHALVGGRLTGDQADQLSHKLEAELPDYQVSHSVSRGHETGRIDVVFRFSRTERSRWLHFQPSTSKLIYHAEQGWSGALDINMGGGNGMFTVGLVKGNNDDLVEEYSGYSLRVESREAGNARLGMSLGFSRYTQEWNAATLSALALEPNAIVYRRRQTLTPAVTFALTRAVHVTGGVMASELTSDGESPHANAGLFIIGYDQRWRRRDAHDGSHLAASYELHAGTASIESDLIYRRHLARADYSYRRGPNTIVAGLQVGRITGDAPLFERFTLGDSATLRGWNKYDLVPAGASRMTYGSIEYRYSDFAYFLDAGTIGAAGDDGPVRLSTGIGFHGEHAFATVGVPLNSGKLAGTFMMGLRF